MTPHVAEALRIVADSIAENEYREAESKAAALFRAVEIAEKRSGSAP